MAVEEDEICFPIIIDWIIVRKNYIKLICGILYPTLLANYIFDKCFRERNTNCNIDCII